MQVILLAAGHGSRMGHLTQKQHKSLLPVNKEHSFLSKLLHQLNEYELNKVVIVTGFMSSSIEDLVSNYQLNYEVIYNKKYKEDTNIYSMKLAMDCLSKDDNTIVLETDIIIDDLAFKNIYFESIKCKSTWFTRGKFASYQYGGILKSAKNNKVEDLKIVNRYSSIYNDYHKLSGIMSISKNQFNEYKFLLNKYCESNIKQYYLIPWIENQNKLPSYFYDLGPNKALSINTDEEYENFINSNKRIIKNNINMVNVNNISPIEHFIKKRVEILKKKILKDNVWTKPIIIDDKNNLLMDGHHRFEVAKQLGFNKIPAIKISYDSIEIWSLKSSELVTKELVKKRALIGEIYPNKTVKHYFKFEVKQCDISLSSLII
jgi:L-serine kinase (ADP)